jgi:hypothetical protein
VGVKWEIIDVIGWTEERDAIQFRSPQIFTLKMTIAVFADTLENLQQSMRLIP